MAARIGDVQAPARVESRNSKPLKGAGNGPDFKELLRKSQQTEPSLNVSKHAQARLDVRNIKLDSQTLDKLKKAVSLAESKGIKESLILVDNAAYIVNVPNKTVVTAVDSQSTRDRVFTNIDGAILT